MSERSISSAKSAMLDILKDYHLVKKLQEQGEDDLAYSYLYEEAEVTDPNTGEEEYFDQGYGVEIRKQIILTLGGGGPAVRAVLYVDKYGDVQNCHIQHQDWMEKWTDLELENGVQEDALEWFLTDALSIQDYAQE